MARGKKNHDSLTPAERLQQALVPVEEQPYEVPANWVWVKLGAVASFIGGGTPSKSVESYWNGEIPWASVKDIKGDVLMHTADSITAQGLQCSSSSLCGLGDLLLVTRIEPGKSIIANIRVAINQDIKIVRSHLLSRYLHLLFQSLKHEFIRRASGSTVLGVTIQGISEIAIPFPPLAEQQRIVDRIESLFSKLDQVKELVEEALDTFETRKAAILQQAFTGKLTAKWREERQIGLSSWRQMRLSECVLIMQNGLSKRGGTGGVPTVVLRLANVVDGRVDNSDLRLISLEDVERDRYLLRKGDLIAIRVNGSKENVGRLILYTVEEAWAFCDHMIRIRTNTDILLPEYLTYFSGADGCRAFVRENMVSSAGQNTISQKSLGELLICVPPLLEQAEIARILDRILGAEQRAIRVSAVLETVDMLKKGVLAKAFCGELGTNEPDEESF